MKMLDEGRPIQAVAAARQRLLGNGGPAELTLLGNALLAAAAPQRALAAFLTALDCRPAPEQALGAHLGAAAALRRMSHPKDAILHLQAASRLDPSHAGAHRSLAKIQYLHGSRSLAVQHLAALSQIESVLPGTGSAAHLRSRLGLVPSPFTTVRYATAEELTVGAPVRVDSAGGSAGANETTIAATHSVPPVLLAGWNDDRGIAESALGVGVSLDGGASWTDFPLSSGPPGLGTLAGDPMTAFDPRTGDLWIGGIIFGVDRPGAVVVAHWPSGGTLGDPVVAHQGTGFLDKGWMAAGPAPGRPDSTRVYVAYSLGVQSSEDLGATWSPPTPLGPGNGFLPRVGPAGELYVAYQSVGLESGHWLRRSLDGGASFEPRRKIADRLVSSLDEAVPGSFRVSGFGTLTIDPRDGGLHFVFDDDSGDGNVDLYLTSSEDGGTTWSVPRVIECASHSSSDQLMPWLEVDAHGGLHLLFYDTRHTPQSDQESSAWLDAYYAYSRDRGETWIEARLTEVSFDSSKARYGASAQFLGDYQGLAVTGDLVFPAYASTVNGDLDIFVHEIRIGSGIFVDGFESGNSEAWIASSLNPRLRNRLGGGSSQPLSP
ncbi:MAG: glycoside hydrolase [Holophagales bacterium]|nr:glycoside hydrolase [Holophagales bacterium]